jgi:hypothetical protein
VNEWTNVVVQGAIFAACIELGWIGKWVLTDGWSGCAGFIFD